MIPEVAAAEPAVVVVSGGRSDLNLATTSTSEWADGVEAFFVTLRRAVPDATIIAISPIWDDDPVPAVLHEMGAVVEGAVTAVGGIYVDLGDPLLGHPELMFRDGVSPNDAGHAAIVEAFEAAYHPEGS